MTLRPSVLLVLSVLGLAGCAYDIHDLRLERAFRPAPGLVPTRVTGLEIDLEGRVVVELSSREDIRRHVARFSDSFAADTQSCVGASHGNLRQPASGATAVSGVFDAFGFLDLAGSVRPGSGDIREASSGSPQAGRYHVMTLLPRLSEPEAERRAHADLCLALSGAQMFFGNRWRTNTVVIPHALIRAALDATPSPAAEPLPTRLPASAGHRSR